MYIKLPDNFERTYAKLENNMLLIYNSLKFENLMYELAYVINKNVCKYCGRKLDKETRSIDHLYPLNTGGISITNNLTLSCKCCNSAKSNLTYNEYIQSKCVKNRKEYIHKVQSYNENIRRKMGFKLPRRWIIFLRTDSIIIEGENRFLKGKKYTKALEYYQKYTNFSKPIIVDKNNRMLDGYNNLMIAINLGIERIPVVKLDNVEIIIKEK